MNGTSGRLTMQQVADRLGLSRMTVSSVVNGLGRERGVKKETELRVREFLKKVGYVPSLYARRLRRKDVPAIGVLHAGFLMSHLRDAYHLFTNALVDRENAVDIVALPRQESREGLKDFVGRGIPTLLWIQNNKESAVQHERIGELFPYLAQFDKVVIYNHTPAPPAIEARMDDLGIRRLVIDRPAANRLAAAFLARLGHRVVAFPDADRETLRDLHRRDPAEFTRAGIERVIGLRDPNEDSGVSPAWGCRHAERLARAVREEGVTAAWLYDDETAGYLLADLADRGIRVPEDLTLLGFDGLAIGQAFHPPLTTIAVPVERMVRQACALFAAETTGPELTYTFEPVLIERRSHGTPGGRP